MVRNVAFLQPARTSVGLHACGYGAIAETNPTKKQLSMEQRASHIRRCFPEEPVVKQNARCCKAGHKAKPDTCSTHM